MKHKTAADAHRLEIWTDGKRHEFSAFRIANVRFDKALAKRSQHVGDSEWAAEKRACCRQSKSPPLPYKEPAIEAIRATGATNESDNCPVPFCNDGNSGGVTNNSSIEEPKEPWAQRGEKESWESVEVNTHHGIHVSRGHRTQLDWN